MRPISSINPYSGASSEIDFGASGRFSDGGKTRSRGGESNSGKSCQAGRIAFLRCR